MTTLQQQLKAAVEYREMLNGQGADGLDVHEDGFRAMLEEADEGVRVAAQAVANNLIDLGYPTEDFEVPGAASDNAVRHGARSEAKRSGRRQRIALANGGFEIVEPEVKGVEFPKLRPAVRTGLSGSDM